ncbi:TorF family putative porin [Pseudoduganella lutea]|uniref:Choline dehydrogenase n=1 Tax=Pseudoduganella lutea TaxID=321985 RepID=A0A4P6KSX5_9BURK|nr:TorF family putative porin [Pseudoduganella lutea]QBE61744.1 choline dehydrogenase [Pseudoduganella lutea]
MNQAQQWSIALLPVLCLAVFAGAAHASDTDAEKEPQAQAAQWTATTSVVSQYVSRGIRQTWGKPAVQAGVDYVRPDGWSAGTWASTVSDRFMEDGRVEWDLYGGYSGSAGAIGYSVMAYCYAYPGARMSATGDRFDYAELALGFTWRAAYAKYYRTVSAMFFGIPDSRGTGYLDVGANPDLGNGWTLNLHAGNGRVAGAGNDIWNWRDAKAGVTKDLGGGWSASLAVTRAWGRTGIYKTYTTGIADSAGNLRYANVAKATAIVGVSRAF